jgi:chromatin structure-remodeling complex subunit RSC1/2
MRHVPTQQKSMRGQTPDAEIDVVAEEDGQEEEGPGNRSERDPMSEEIVKQLEKGLPSWPGFGSEGWLETLSSVGDLFICAFVYLKKFWQERIIDIVSALKSHKDIL